MTSDDPETTAADAAALARSVADVKHVGGVSATDDPDLVADGGRAQLVQVTLRGDPDNAEDHVSPLEQRVQTFDEHHPESQVEQAGEASLTNAIDEIVEEDLGKAEMISLPITLLILFLAFGALVAASVPLLLGITAVAGAMGALGPRLAVAPMADAAGSLVVLIGLAVGVDYSLFYIRREREERRAGRGPTRRCDAAAATVGRAIVVSGLTVMVALAGLLLTGLAVFASMALGTILVVAIAVLGSLTVLPAMLALLGDRIDRGRLPFGAAVRARRERPRAAAAVGAHRRTPSPARPRRARWSPRSACSAPSPCRRSTCSTRRLDGDSLCPTTSRSSRRSKRDRATPSPAPGRRRARRHGRRPRLAARQRLEALRERVGDGADRRAHGGEVAESTAPRS